MPSAASGHVLSNNTFALQARHGRVVLLLPITSTHTIDPILLNCVTMTKMRSAYFVSTISVSTPSILTATCTSTHAHAHARAQHGRGQAPGRHAYDGHGSARDQRRVVTAACADTCWHTSCQHRLADPLHMPHELVRRKKLYLLDLDWTFGRYILKWHGAVLTACGST